MKKREEGEPDIETSRGRKKRNPDKKKEKTFFFPTISWLQNFDETSFHDFSFFSRIYNTIEFRGF